MKKVLLTGASSFLGWNVCELAASTHEVHGIIHTHSSNRPDITEHRLDLTDFPAIDRVCEDIHPDCIVHVAAYSKPDQCERDPVRSKMVNVDATIRLVRHASNLDIPFVFTSTDLVFDGTIGNYDEASPTNPVSVYGKHKVLAEDLARELHAKVLICRCPLMYGYSGTENQSYLPGLLEKMERMEPVKLFTDEFRSQAYARDVAEGLLNLMNQHSYGIYHLGGPENISRYDFGLLAQQVFGFRDAEIIPALQEDVQSIPMRPPDVSLNSEKATRKGFRPKAPEEGLKEMKKLMQYHSGSD